MSTTEQLSPSAQGTSLKQVRRLLSHASQSSLSATPVDASTLPRAFAPSATRTASSFAPLLRLRFGYSKNLRIPQESKS
eukprot:6487646-Amphidinium_carterae.1